MPRDGTLPKTLVALVADLFCGAGGSPTGARGLAGPDRLGVDQVVWYGAAIMALCWPATPSEVKFAADLYGAFPVKRLFWVVLTVFCSERERPFFVPSPAIRSPERAEGVKGPKR